MLNMFKNFANDESGAVTVDWVVLTAGIVVLGTIVMVSVTEGVTSLASGISDAVAATPIASTPATPPAP